jgi:hypothetical protein
VGDAMSAALEAIRAEAMAEEKRAEPAAPMSGEQAAPSVPAVDVDAAEVDAWAQLPAAFGSVLCMALPELREHYSDANCRAWGEAMHSVAKKHGWSFRDVGPYLGLALATVPLAVPTVIAVRARRAQVRADSALPAAESPAAEPARERQSRVAPVG